MFECVCNFISEGSFSLELFTLSPKAIWQFQVWQGLNWLIFNNNFSVYAKLFSPFNPVSVTLELFTSSHWVLACSRDDQQSIPTTLFSSNNIHKSSAFKTTLRIVIFLSWKLYVFLFWFKKFYATFHLYHHCHVLPASCGQSPRWSTHYVCFI